jgi:hypothetical protein
LLAQFSADTGAARRAYARFVGQGLAADDPMRNVQGQLFRGVGDVSLQDLTPGVRVTPGVRDPCFPCFRFFSHVNASATGDEARLSQSAQTVQMRTSASRSR